MKELLVGAALLGTAMWSARRGGGLSGLGDFPWTLKRGIQENTDKFRLDVDENAVWLSNKKLDHNNVKQLTKATFDKHFDQARKKSPNGSLNTHLSFVWRKSK